jgi:hypothetical protein
VGECCGGPQRGRGREEGRRAHREVYYG